AGSRCPFAHERVSFDRVHELNADRERRDRARGQDVPSTGGGGDLVADSGQNRHEYRWRRNLALGDERRDGCLMAVVAREPSARRNVRTSNDCRGSGTPSIVEDVDRERSVRRLQPDAAVRLVAYEREIAAQPVQSHTVIATAVDAIDHDPDVV